MAYVNFLGSVHKRTERDYGARVKEYPKAEAALLAKALDRDCWDGYCKIGYGGYHYDGHWRAATDTIVDHSGIRPEAKGYGKSSLLYDLTQSGPRVEVMGIDISKYAIENAKQELKPHLLGASAAELPFEADSFDLAISGNVLHNLQDFELASALGELKGIGRKHVHVRRVLARTAREEEPVLLPIDLRDALHAGKLGAVVPADRLHRRSLVHLFRIGSNSN